MPRTVADQLARAPLSRFENVSPVMAKADLKNLEQASRADLGRAIARCFKLADLTQKEGAALLNRDQAQIARWIAATEPPQVHAILAVPSLRHWLVLALAEGVGVDIEFIVHLKRPA